MKRIISRTESRRLVRQLAGGDINTLIGVKFMGTGKPIGRKRRDQLRELGLVDDTGLTKLGHELLKEARRRGF